jgi:hypothetical protein
MYVARSSALVVYIRIKKNTFSSCGTGYDLKFFATEFKIRFIIHKYHLKIKSYTFSHTCIHTHRHTHTYIHPHTHTHT